MGENYNLGKNPVFFYKNMVGPPFPPLYISPWGQKVPPPLEPFWGVLQFLRHSPPLWKSRRPCVLSTYDPIALV